jgi:hypothetical protein
MAESSSFTTETPEQQEARRRRAVDRRMRVLAAVAVVVIASRFFVSDPKRKAPIDYTRVPNMKVVPGMLDTMPAASRANLDQRLVAKVIIADEQVRRGEYGKEQKPVQIAQYKPADPPTKIDLEAATLQEFTYSYARRRQIDLDRQRRQEEAPDLTKDTLVQFASGGHVLAEKANRSSRGTMIRLNRTIEANVPNRWVSNIKPDSVGWTEPVPAGKVRIKPAKGITIVIDRGMAGEITTHERKFDEI